MPHAARLRHRMTRTSFVIAALTVSTSFFVASEANAEPSASPLPPMIIGPLQYGPPAYPPAVGVPLLPAGKAGVAASADSLSPTGAPPSSPAPAPGIAGVRPGVDALSPLPGPRITEP